MTKKILLAIIVIACLIAVYLVYRHKQYKYPLPNTAKNVDLTKYAGKWYEIALIPNHFERGCSRTSATYTLKNGYITVKNECYKTKEEKYDQIEGRAWSTNSDNSKLKVQFFWPFRGDYWILYVDNAYQYALVGSPSRKYLWILARTKQISQQNFKKLVDIAKQNNFDVEKLLKTNH